MADDIERMDALEDFRAWLLIIGFVDRTKQRLPYYPNLSHIKNTYGAVLPNGNIVTIYTDLEDIHLIILNSRIKPVTYDYKDLSILEAKNIITQLLTNKEDSTHGTK